MPNAPYRQFCPLARAVEIVGERWTLLVVRELLLRSQRFSDLLSRLEGISTSVLADRLGGLEEAGLAKRTVLRQPVPATVYELTEDGRALEPAVLDLARWGYRRLLPRRPDDRLDAEWVTLALAAGAQGAETRRSSFAVEVLGARDDVTVYVSGGPRGTIVHGPPGTAHTVIRCDPETLLQIVSGALNPVEAHVAGRIEVQGDLSALPVFPRLFDVPVSIAPPAALPELVEERIAG